MIKNKIRSNLTLAGSFPLFFEILSDEQAESSSKIIESQFLKDGGLLTTTIKSGQQWDAPNGWAPLQWITFIGLKKYGYNQLASQIKKNWINQNEKVFKNSGKFTEKYNVVDISSETGGGEYPNQDGFGWTNGVYLALKNEF